MGTLVQMAKESKSMLLENSVSYLSIGYTVVLDSTDQEVSYWYYMMSENDTNVSCFISGKGRRIDTREYIIRTDVSSITR